MVGAAMSNGVVDLAGVITGVASSLIALVAVIVAIRSDRRSREVVKVQTYLMLRSGFLDIYRQLGALEDANADSVDLRLTRQAYWHHAWDEWYIAKKVAPREFEDLWDDFFSVAVQSGLKHPALRSVLDDLIRDTEVGFGAYAKEFVAMLDRDAGHETMRGTPSERVRHRTGTRWRTPVSEQSPDPARCATSLGGAARGSAGCPDACPSAPTRTGVTDGPSPRRLREGGDETSAGR
jgi:hypothetical protein